VGGAAVKPEHRVAVRLLQLDVMKLEAAQRQLARGVRGARAAGVSRAEVCRLTRLSPSAVARIERDEELARVV
jgi:hypothetical protein